MLQRLPSYLTLNRFGIYYFQYRVPEYQLNLHGGRKLIRKSLRTRDRRLALSLAQRWFQRMQDKDLFEYEQKITSDADLYSRGRSIHEEYDKLDRNDVHSEDEFFMRLSEYDKEALQYYSKIAASRQAAESIPATPKTQQQPHQTGIEEVDGSPRLNQLVERYITEKRHGWGEHSAIKTEKTVRGHLNLFVESIGSNAPISKLSKADISLFKDTLMNLPANRSKILPYCHKTLNELRHMKVPERHRISSQTIKDYSNRVIGFLDWCADNEGVDSDLSAPLRGAKKTLRRSKRSKDQRDVFSDSDLKKLFLSKQYLQSSHKNPSHHWIPLLALFTGARLGELCQLHVDDIKFDEHLGIYYMDINDLDDKGTKSESSNRVVPIHDQLIRLGFIDYVKSMKRKRLFPDVKKSKDGSFELMSRWFNRTYRNRSNCNVGQGINEHKTFHSFRHTFLNSFKQMGLSMDLAEEMAGHAPSGSETRVRYAKDSNLGLKNKMLQKLKYQVDFKKIRVWKDAVKLNSKR